MKSSSAVFRYFNVKKEKKTENFWKKLFLPHFKLRKVLVYAHQEVRSLKLAA